MRAALPMSVAILVWGALPSAAQTRPAVFEVASIKPHPGPAPPGGGHHEISGPRITFVSYSLLGLVMYAYNVKIYDILNASQLDHTFYDVLAQAEDGQTPTVDEFRAMLRGLLEERFKLQAHRETREMAVYALVAGKGGPKLRASAPDAKSSHSITMQGPNYRTTLIAADVDGLADYIRSNAGLDRPTVNQTGLSGTYDIELVYTPESRLRGVEQSGSGADAVSIFDAVRDQLGLTLEKKVAPCNFVVVDHAERATVN